MTNCKNCAAPILNSNCKYCGTIYNKSKLEVTSCNSKKEEYITVDYIPGVAVYNTKFDVILC